MVRFGEFINRWNLIDPPLKGTKFTWSNFRENLTLSRLDRLLFCNEWEDLFPGRAQIALARAIFDYTPIVLEYEWGFGGSSPFKFENVWFLEPDFMELVKYVWFHASFQGNASHIFALKLKTLKFHLIAWNKVTSGYFKEESKICVEKIKDIDRLEEERQLMGEERLIRESYCKKFQMLALKEEVYGHQRSRIRWLKEGDQNTKFFHKVASHNKSSNVIYGLMINEIWSQNKSEIRNEVESYHANIFRDNVLVRPLLDGLEFDKILDVEKS